jgi:hypothetical protein
MTAEPNDAAQSARRSSTDDVTRIGEAGADALGGAGQQVPEVEQQLAFDMVKRGLLVSPAFLAFGAIGWGWDGLASAAFALVLVFGDFLASALLLGWAAKKGPNVLMATAFGGFALRMGVIAFALWAVSDQAWVADVPLAVTLLVAYLGLLFWETRFVSASLAFPGLKPAPPKRTGA